MKENEDSVFGCLMPILIFAVGIAVGGMTEKLTQETLPIVEGLRYLDADHSLTSYYKNPTDGKMVRAWKATTDGKRTIDVTSLDSYWKDIAMEALRTRCGNLEEIASLSSQEKVFLVDDINCLKKE